jgi:septal ring factor EnvC (AmiA/AmiB activator)
MGPGFGPPREADLERMKEHDPEMYELLKQDNDFDRDSRSLAEKVRKLATGVKDREKLETELKELVQKHFDVRQKRREIELKRVEEQLSRLRDSIKTRLEGREESIRRRLAELVGRPEDLGF